MKRASTGFTLLEMIVVLVIIGLLMGLVGPRVFKQADKAKVQTAEAQVTMLKGALQTMRLDINRFPTNEEGLALLLNNSTPENPNWDGPYLEDELPLDPWDRPYQYSTQKTQNRPFELYSFGADGKRGGEDYDADIGYIAVR
ncbi:type II secretion system major pseudopilin GspG [Alteromonas oceanisediminis]|uniref:type II secretion system major pseudopilin GspG n=1 Tax=Alteromonas oceanisediminis TaxID=2836180 RepID=UPI001BDA3F9C|nr:type II secretion system major pseudopilin GspG [Alteromonas oceanisediminis]MBT0585045.1 type II secretion system major pseudopilin GspG [Alteromonas oceanisediminis]